MTSFTAENFLFWIIIEGISAADAWAPRHYIEIISDHFKVNALFVFLPESRIDIGLNLKVDKLIIAVARWADDLYFVVLYSKVYMA